MNSIAVKAYTKMNTNKILSVIVPVYNVERYLHECVESLLRYDGDDIEVILVDDGSPDNCPVICNSFAYRKIVEDCSETIVPNEDKRVTVIHQKNAGVAAARNAGLDIAQCEWIWFVDSDDVVDVTRLPEILRYMREHDDVDLVMFDLKDFTDVPAVEGAVGELQVDDSLSKNDFLMKYHCNHHQRLFYRKSWMIIDHHQRGTLRFTRGIRVSEDLEFQYKYLTRCKHPVKIDAVLYHYRHHDGSVTGDNGYRCRVVEDNPKVLMNLYEWCKDTNVQPEAYIDYRIMKMLQNMLYSASLIEIVDVNRLQKDVRNAVDSFASLAFPFVCNKKIRLAYWNVRMYIFFNRAYLIIRGLK